MTSKLGRVSGAESTPPAVAVLAVAPVLMISIERGPHGVREVHLHPGGQGFWVARMVARLGVSVELVGPFGGEPGCALTALIERDGVRVRAVAADEPNGVWISDQQEGDPATVVDHAPPPLSRHGADSLLDRFLTAGLGARVTVITGDPSGESLDTEAYRRLAHDLHALEGVVLADLSGDALAGALAGGLDVAKVSHEELIEAGYATGAGEAELVAGIRALRARGAGAVLVSRADAPLLAHTGERLVCAETPDFEPLNHRGAGDSMTGAMAAALAEGRPVEEALRRAVAAGALNVRRQGLGTGSREAIERLAERVDIRALSA